MSSDWTKVRLNEIADITMGQSPSSEYYNLNGIGLPFFQGCSEFGELYPSERKYCSKPTRIAKRDDVLMSVRAPVGDLNIANKECCIGRGVCSIRSKTGDRFVYYLLKVNLGLIQSYSSGTTYQSINKKEVNELPLFVPTLLTQRKIASILSVYDNLIENNTRRIQILEEMAQRIYKKWFVDFKYPGHENDELVDSELGMIPEGWEIKSLKEISVNFDRKRIPLSSMVRADMKGDYPYYGAAKIFDYINKYIFDGCYLLLAEDGSVITDQGNPVLQLVKGKFWVNNHAHVLQGIYPISTEFLTLALSNVKILGYITGAAQPKISQTNMNRIPLIKAPENILNRFYEITESIFSAKFIFAEENKNLRQTRDLLLPKLISGKIDVSDLDIDTSLLDD